MQITLIVLAVIGYSATASIIDDKCYNELIRSMDICQNNDIAVCLYRGKYFMQTSCTQNNQLHLSSCSRYPDD